MDDNQEGHRIKRLNDQTAASVRGSQVIGTVARAVEELVLNSTEGGAKSCTITMGTNEIIVSDDGVGIDPDAMRSFIGTEYCSNVASQPQRDSLLNDTKGKKGESLRSIAALCVDMKIETACVCSDNNSDNRKRKLSVEDAPDLIVKSVKVFKDGAVVSFNQSSDGSGTTSAIIPMMSDTSKPKIGTTITIQGLFHRHIVRRKHHQQDKTSHSTELSQIRASLRLLALSFPNVTFQLKNGVTGKVDCSFQFPEGADKSMIQSTMVASPSLNVESRALIARLGGMYPNDFVQEDTIELVFDESKGRSSLKKSGSELNFRAFGALCISDAGDGGGEEIIRNKELEIVAINGRLATHCSKLADSVLSQVRLSRGSSYTACFFIHVSSPSFDLVVKDSIATISVPQGEKLAKFLKTMVAKALINCGHSMLYQPNHSSSQSIAHSQDSSWIVGEKRIVRGQHIVSSFDKTTTTSSKECADAQSNIQPKSPASPFSSAFFDTVQQPKLQPTYKPTNTKAKMASKPKVDEDSSPLSFEDAFLDNPTKKLASIAAKPVAEDSPNYDFEDEQDTSEKWTKQRVKGLERKIAAMTSTNASASDDKISLTKEMLVNAEVIAQVAEKFIIVRTGSLILAIDQHAADERVALEKLERALFNPDMHDDIVVHLTHKDVRVSDILKSSKQYPAKRISLSQKDISTVKHHWSLLQKWKFTLQETEIDQTLLLTGLPEVCGRTADVKDFFDFVSVLGHCTGGREIRPQFVKNVLASNACRYAIMFGDTLTHEKCVELIEALSKCEFCFICAHGRPSVIPLIDMNQDSKHCPLPCVANANVEAKGERSLKFGPKRVIRRRLDGPEA